MKEGEFLLTNISREKIETYVQAFYDCLEKRETKSARLLDIMDVLLQVKKASVN